MLRSSSIKLASLQTLAGTVCRQLLFKYSISSVGAKREAGNSVSVLNSASSWFAVLRKNFCRFPVVMSAFAASCSEWLKSVYNI